MLGRYFDPVIFGGPAETMGGVVRALAGPGPTACAGRAGRAAAAAGGRRSSSAHGRPLRGRAHAQRSHGCGLGRAGPVHRLHRAMGRTRRTRAAPGGATAPAPADHAGRSRRDLSRAGRGPRPRGAHHDATGRACLRPCGRCRTDLRRRVRPTESWGGLGVGRTSWPPNPAHRSGWGRRRSTALSRPWATSPTSSRRTWSAIPPALPNWPQRRDGSAVCRMTWSATCGGPHPFTTSDGSPSLRPSGRSRDR